MSISKAKSKAAPSAMANESPILTSSNQGSKIEDFFGETHDSSSIKHRS
ncbi:hypothetical protein CCACVL1_19111 [Corchorus capsularis]|uniref:Uncharacterized protein n=1 Tax=Corchorus capsularis TaxID=210143 RepID=A0A1R3HIC5_COCAP|nr:hypothetical protein CCACVL1_19111 [Corchorus capsularis]